MSVFIAQSSLLGRLLWSKAYQLCTIKRVKFNSPPPILEMKSYQFQLGQFCNFTVYTPPPSPNKKFPVSAGTSLQFHSLNPSSPDIEKLPFSSRSSDLQFKPLR